MSIPPLVRGRGFTESYMTLLCFARKIERREPTDLLRIEVPAREVIR
jgi:hypothetical protein